jgi:hypothetical protein
VTEADWLACTDPQKMLEFLLGTNIPRDLRFWSGRVAQVPDYPHSKITDRQLRLFACACCRRIWHLLVDGRSRKAVEVSELYADGLADHIRLARARHEAREARRKCPVPDQVVAWRAAGAAQDATRDTGSSAAFNCLAETARAVNVGDTNHCDPAELQHQASILLDIVGNPFRPVPLDPPWLAWAGGTVPKLARAIYDDRAFDRLPVLADALEEAGCTDAAILDHLRGPGPHGLGCWALDLLSGKG